MRSAAKIIAFLHRNGFSTGLVCLPSPWSSRPTLVRCISCWSCCSPPPPPWPPLPRAGSGPSTHRAFSPGPIWLPPLPTERDTAASTSRPPRPPCTHPPTAWCTSPATSSIVRCSRSPTPERCCRPTSRWPPPSSPETPCTAATRSARSRAGTARSSCACISGCGSAESTCRRCCFSVGCRARYFYLQSRTGVRQRVALLQPLGRHVRVDLGRSEARVAEQFLHGAQVGAAVEQVGSRRVS